MELWSLIIYFTELGPECTESKFTSNVAMKHDLYNKKTKDTLVLKTYIYLTTNMG